jgi:pimeloyl-ACP methyl ester carboxylesterase
MNYLEEYKIEINGLKYKYYDTLIGEKTIIFIHGLGSNKDPMTKFFAEYLDKFRCIFIDLPSHNQIPSYEFKKLDDFSEYVLNFLSYLKIDDFSLIGFSFGGLVAIQTSKILAKQDKFVKTVAWASPLEKSFLTFRSKQFLKLFDAIQNKHYKKLPKSNWFQLMTAIFGIKVKDKELESFTNFDNSRLDIFHKMMPDTQINTSDIKMLYIFGTKDPLINSKAFEKTIVNNINQKKFLVEKGGHYLDQRGRKESLKIIHDFIYDF